MIKTKISVWDEIGKFTWTLCSNVLFITQNLTCLKISGALKICLGGKVTEYKIPINSESSFHIKRRKQRYLGCFKYCFVDIWLEKKAFQIEFFPTMITFVRKFAASYHQTCNETPFNNFKLWKHIKPNKESLKSRIKLNDFKIQQLTHTRFVYIIIRV